MKPVLVFGAGKPDTQDFYEPYFSEPSTIIAIDGGANVLHQCRQLPDWFIGDEDSLFPKTKRWLQKNKILYFSYPKEKNESDFELASIKISNDFEPCQIDIFCMQGNRSDHFLFNLSICENLFEKGFSPILRSFRETIYFLDKTRPLKGIGNIGDIVSIYPLHNSVLIHKIKGLKYDLLDEWVSKESTRGLSNELTNSSYSVKVLEGKMLVFHVRKGF